MNVLTFFGLNPLPSYGGEVGFLRLLGMGGMPTLTAFLILSISEIKKINIKIKISDAIHRPFLYGCLAYMISFFLSQFNLPLVFDFACMGLYALMIIFANCDTPDYEPCKQIWKNDHNKIGQWE